MEFQFVSHDFHMRLENIGAVAVDAQDNLYVCVRGGDTPLVVFDREGTFLRGLGREMGVVNPHCVRVDPQNNIWLIDCARHIVYKMDQEGEVLMTLGKIDQPSWDSGVINGDYRTIQRPGSPFNGPARLAIAPDGDLYVADGYHNCCVHHFSPDGTLLHSWGAPGDAPGSFCVVHSVFVDPENKDVYVADRENRRVQIFTSEGMLKAIWPDLHRPTDICIHDGYVYVSELGEFLFTDAIQYDYHIHRHHSQVRVFTKDGVEVGQIGSEEIGAPGTFFAAHCLCLDSRGDLYVGEVNNWDLYSLFTAWPGGVGMPRDRHPGVQKFVRKK